MFSLIAECFQKPGIKAAFFIITGFFYANFLLLSLTINLVLLLIVLFFIILTNLEPKLNEINHLLYFLLLILVFGLSVKIRLQNTFYDSELKLDKTQKVEISAILRGIANKRNNNVTLITKGETISYKGKNRRINQPFLIQFDSLLPKMEYDAKLRVSGYLNGFSKMGKFYLTEARLLDYEISSSAWFKNRLYILRTHLKQVFQKFIPSSADHLAIALLLGERYELDKAVIEKFRETGVSHVLAISGLHLSLLLGFFFFFFQLLGCPQKYIMYSLIIVLIIYTALVNFLDSVVRAALMAGIIIGARLIYRNSNLVNVLGATVSIIALIVPQSLTNVGMQLSVGATFFIVAVLPPLSKIIFTQYYFSRLEKWFIQSLLVTISAWVGVLPLIAWYFYEINAMSLIASLVVVPLTGALLFLSFCLVWLSWLSPLNIIIGKMFYWVSEFTLEVINFLAESNILRFQSASPSLILIILYYLTALVFFSFLEKRASQVKEISLPLNSVAGKT